MKEIISKELGNEQLALGAEHNHLHVYDGLTTPVSRDVIVLTAQHATEIESYAIRSAASYGDSNGNPEPTLAHTRDGVPSYVVRVDCTVQDGNIVPYEMEDSPSGQGITDRLHKSILGADFGSRIRDHYHDALGQLPAVIISDHRNHGTDDTLILGADNYHFGLPSQLPTDKPVIVKAIPGMPQSHADYLHLQSQAVAPLVTEGNKSYAEQNGDLTRVTDSLDLLRGSDGELSSQVLKARLGSMAMGISIYLSPVDRKTFGKKGIVTGSRLLNDLTTYNEHSAALLQPFVAPIQLENPQGRSNAIMRIFVLLSRGQLGINAKAIGGCYVARPELIVHGASNAVGGVVCVE